jgi:hypothetical protein
MHLRFSKSMARLGAAIHLSKSKTSILGMFGAASLLCVAAPSAKAADFTPVFTLPSSPNTITPDSSIRVFGYNFTTSLARTIKSVGIYSQTSTDHNIGIWDFTAAPVLLYQQQVLKSDPCNLYQSFCWVNIPDISLSTSKNYAIAATWGSSEPVPAQVSPSDILINVSQFSLNDTARIIPGDPLPLSYLADLTAYPPIGISNIDNKGYYSVNLSFDSYSSPPSSQVPAPLPLFGAAAAFGMSRKIRRRISAAS